MATREDGLNELAIDVSAAIATLATHLPASGYILSTILAEVMQLLRAPPHDNTDHRTRWHLCIDPKQLPSPWSI